MIAAEDLGVPTVALCNEGFWADARSAAHTKGMPGLRLVFEAIPCEATVAAEVEEGVRAVMGQVIDALTRPLTIEELNPQPKVPDPGPRIVFRGSLEEVNRYFYKMGWTDGLPIVPPTEQAVEAMLQGTDLPPDYVVAEFIPRMGKATVEKIAINAVMAGCLPIHLPVIIGAVQALMDPRSGYAIAQVSTGSWAPFWVINGPIRKDLRLNSGTGALNPGNIANATIGRAMELIRRNIGGARSGIEDMSVFGNPGKYTMVLAENEEDSPWPSLAVDHGFRADDNVVSVFFPNSFLMVMCQGTDPERLLFTLAENVPVGKRNAITGILMIPQHARILAEAGWSKGDVLDYLLRHSRVPVYGEGPPPRMVGPHQVDPIPPVESWEPTWPDPSRSLVRVIVAGGPGSFMGLLFSTGRYSPERAWVSKPIELPRRWGRLVDRYRAVVPRYDIGCGGSSGHSQPGR